MVTLTSKSMLDNNGATPLYLQIANFIKRQLTDGTYPHGEKLPTETEFSAMFSVSRPTVRRALSILMNEHMIERVPGRGTFATRQQPHHSKEQIREDADSVAVLGPGQHSIFFQPILSGIAEETSRCGRLLMLRSSGSSVVLEQTHLNNLRGQVDGFVIMPADAHQPHNVLLDMYQEGVPMVFVDRYLESIDVPFVVSDNLQGGFLATKHLIDLGHRRVGFVAMPNLYVTSAGQRLRGYQRALEQAGLKLDPGLVFQGLLPPVCDSEIVGRLSSRRVEYDRSVICEFLSADQRPDAIVACDDVIAVRILEACRELGLHVPQDVAIVGFDDDSFSSMVTPRLTTIHQQKLEMGARAARTLIDLLDGKPVQKQVFLPTELIVRESCGAK